MHRVTGLGTQQHVPSLAFYLVSEIHDSCVTSADITNSILTSYLYRETKKSQVHSFSCAEPSTCACITSPDKKLKTYFGLSQNKRAMLRDAKQFTIFSKLPQRFSTSAIRVCLKEYSEEYSNIYYENRYNHITEGKRHSIEE